MARLFRILEKRSLRFLLFGVLAAAFMVAGLLRSDIGSMWLHVFIRHGGDCWIPVGMDSSRLSPSMRLALQGSSAAVPGEYHWTGVSTGFEVAELPVTVGGREVDRILLARIDPARYRFAVFNDSTGKSGLSEWMAKLGAVLVVNGSYYSHHATPDTPFLSNGTLLGPSEYDAKAGAFVASPGFTGIRDLSKEDWKSAFRGADNAMVSYPLLLANGAPYDGKASQWLANRSFVGQDGTGRIIIGTTKDAYFSLYRLARFLHDTSLGLTFALNLDGGPVASQGISLNGYERKTIGRWELQFNGQRGSLLTWPYGTFEMPIVLAVFRK